MSILNILEFPDPRLRKKAQELAVVNDNTRNTIEDMFETMYSAPGIGLAATQVDIHQRLFVLDISEDKSSPLVFINPIIDIIDPEPFSHEEGCLSVPEYYELIERASKISVKALDRDGQAFTLEAEGLLAVCIQHEVDHLEGKLFVDYLSTLKRHRLKTKLLKQHKKQ